MLCGELVAVAVAVAVAVVSGGGASRDASGLGCVGAVCFTRLEIRFGGRGVHAFRWAQECLFFGYFFPSGGRCVLSRRKGSLV